ncbi:MAG: ribonuclease H-like domain-containing protein [Chloroflexota bacterium]
MSDLRTRLRSLRAATRPVVRPAELPPTPEGSRTLDEGDLHETPLGASYFLRTLHPPDTTHGEGILDQWLTQNLAAAAVFTRDPRLATVDPRRCLFLDTETTGLNAGAGTLVFLVGVGLFTDDGFEVRQYFLRDPAEEPAMLHAIRDLMEHYEALVTFNGRSFDVPLLSMRYTLNRQRLNGERWPNLDLLFPARRLWKRRLESCRLSSLERAILGVQRTGQDVPGWLIPQLYQEYLQTGDARQMRRVMYHNLLDVLSMVTLATTLCDTFTRSDMALPHDDLLSLARWYEQLNMTEQAENTFWAALKAARHDAQHIACLEGLAAMLKRQDRHSDAEPLWEALATLSPLDSAPRIELAKYHEWTTGDFSLAISWTEAAVQANAARPRSFEQQGVQIELNKRLERLQRKYHKRLDQSGSHPNHHDEQ